MDQKDLKQIGELIKDSIEDNNKVLALLMDVKFEQFENKFEQKMLEWK
ncbi:MAG: hypothetical protein WC784_03425 [Candidatus Shapirobacteria bacterium]